MKEKGFMERSDPLAQITRRLIFVSVVFWRPGEVKITEKIKKNNLNFKRTNHNTLH